MTDFDYDVMQKKRIASGDRHRKRGSKSTYCGLPSDHMTPSQWKKRNGEVKIMNLNEPMNWTAFKEMPQDLQVEYIQKLVDRFHCTMADLSSMFRVQPMTISRHFKEIGVSGLFQRGKKMTSEQCQAFTEWLGQSDMEHRAAHRSVPSSDAVSVCQRMDMTWSGDVNLVSVLDLVHQFTNGRPVYLRVIVEKEAVHEPF